MKTNQLRKDTIVLMANELSRDILNQEIYVSSSFAEKCGFTRVPGLNIKEDRQRDIRAPITLGGNRFSSALKFGSRNESSSLRIGSRNESSSLRNGSRNESSSLRNGKSRQSDSLKMPKSWS